VSANRSDRLWAGGLSGVGLGAALALAGFAARVPEVLAQFRELDVELAVLSKLAVNQPLLAIAAVVVLLAVVLANALAKPGRARIAVLAAVAVAAVAASAAVYLGTTLPLGGAAG